MQSNVFAMYCMCKGWRLRISAAQTDTEPTEIRNSEAGDDINCTVTGHICGDEQVQEMNPEAARQHLHTGQGIHTKPSLHTGGSCMQIETRRKRGQAHNLVYWEAGEVMVK